MKFFYGSFQQHDVYANDRIFNLSGRFFIKLPVFRLFPVFSGERRRETFAKL